MTQLESIAQGIAEAMTDKELIQSMKNLASRKEDGVQEERRLAGLKAIENELLKRLAK